MVVLGAGNLFDTSQFLQVSISFCLLTTKSNGVQKSHHHGSRYIDSMQIPSGAGAVNLDLAKV